jgi:sodium-dependent dicarboxylate transporter 2/3/5
MPQNEGLLLMMVATVAASYAFMLPIATPPNAIIMSSRVISVKQMATVGFKLNLIGIIVLSVLAYSYWRVML